MIIIFSVTESTNHVVRNVVKVYNLNKHPGWGVIGGVALLLYAVSDLLVPGKGRQSVDGLTGAGHLK